MTTTAPSGNSTDESTFAQDFCRTQLPKVLTRAGVSASDAQAVAADVLHRAQMLAALPVAYFDVLITPFIEEISQHRPVSAPAWLRAAVVVAVRNSRLEDFHALGGPLRAADVATITEAATDPLAALLEKPSRLVHDNPLAGFDTAFPRAWACLTALSDLMESGNGEETSYTLPPAPLPQLPGPDESIRAEHSSMKAVGGFKAVVASGVDPRFDQDLIRMMQQVREGAAEVVPLSALSRLSRNSAKQLRVLEFLLAHQVTVVTTNYLLAPGTVGVRARPLVKPDSYDLRRSFKSLRGLGPAHTRWAKALRKQL
ncbi:recombinase family protein [Streptomyces bauhiniae]|uniref:recombinase family protein n=1 Tax=Streptomyces bauhiniae TaxID=2340725 RepID=UPI00345525BB